MQAANPALAMEHATDDRYMSARLSHYNWVSVPPTSAWHPPSAAEIVLPRLNSMPTACDLVSVSNLHS